MTEIGLAVSTVIFALRPHPETGRPVLSIPLVRRTRAPFEGLWALPGGWVDPAESLATSASRTLVETTGVRPSYLEQLYTFGGLDRSPTGRVVSVVYSALVRPEQIGERTDPAFDAVNVAWFVADALPHLAFDHDDVVAYALWRLRTKVEYSAIAQGLLGSTFTLSELRQVHEAVLDRELDPANFRRQVEASGTVVATGEHVLGGRHRPPRLYRYDTSAPLVDIGPLAADPPNPPSGEPT
jgi:ADP-ribose pyrophosphatase YjhB (NUDIX family)